MSAISVYAVECVCRYHIETQAMVSVCPTCGHRIVIEWPSSAEKIGHSQRIQPPPGGHSVATDLSGAAGNR